MCEIMNCNRQDHKAKGLCSLHYQRSKIITRGLEDGIGGEFMFKTLDITPLTGTVEELEQFIFEGVKDTQRLLITTLPDQLLITRKQFDQLAKRPEMHQMYASKDFFYYTPLNVMEVRVKEEYKPLSEPEI